MKTKNFTKEEVNYTVQPVRNYCWECVHCYGHMSNTGGGFCVKLKSKDNRVMSLGICDKWEKSGSIGYK